MDTKSLAEKIRSALPADAAEDIADIINDFLYNQSMDEKKILNDIADSNASTLIQHLTEKCEWSQEQTDDFAARLKQTFGIDKQIVFSEEEKQLFQIGKSSPGPQHLRMLSLSDFQPFLVHPSDPQQSVRVQRLAYLMQQYQQYNTDSSDKAFDQTSFLYRFIADGGVDYYDANTTCIYNVENLLNDFYFGLVHYCDTDRAFERLYICVTQKVGTLCNVEECAFMKRNHLSSQMGSDEQEDEDAAESKSELYCGFSDPEQRARIQIFDNMHCLLMHSYDVGWKLTAAELLSVEQQDEDGVDADGDGDADDAKEQEKQQVEAVDESADKEKDKVDLVDYSIVQMRRIIRKKRKNLVNVIGAPGVQKNKYVTDIFHGSQYMTRQHLGSGSTDSSSNDDGDAYKPGQRFFYWDYHQKAGWKWYVAAKYSDLKDELQQHSLISVDEWNVYYQKATEIRRTFLCKSYIPVIERYFGTYFYGISEHDALSVDHILSLLFFCNENLQVALNASFVKKHEVESDHELKHKHAFFANWARLLCEAVEVFTNPHFYKPVNLFYHGTNCQTYFDEIYASLYAPTSMTKSRSVMMCYGNENGLLLDLMYDEANGTRNRNKCYFECSWLSNWSGENEIVFVGSAAPLRFQSIIHYSQCHNYRHYIAAMGILEDMLHGHPLHEMPSKAILKAVDDLMHYELKLGAASDSQLRLQSAFQENVNVQKQQSEKVADYVFEFFHHFVANIHYHVQLDLYKLNHDYFGLKKYWLNARSTMVQIDRLCMIFKNVKYLSLLPGWSLQKNHAVVLNKANLEYLYGVLKNISAGNTSSSLQLQNKNGHGAAADELRIECKLERITIENPRCKMSIREAKEEFGALFAEIGWKLSSNGWRKGDMGVPILTIVKM